MKPQQIGRIKLVVGPMFSGKSEWIVGKLRAHQIANHFILAIRFLGDERYNKDSITSHNGSRFLAQSAKTVADIERLLKENPKLEVLAIDEIQFFDPSLSKLLQKEQRRGVQIYVSGLDLDFLGQPWETTNQVFAIADSVEKKLAVCSICKKINATRSQRLIQGKPASKDSPRVLIDGTDSYSARCLAHYEVI